MSLVVLIAQNPSATKLNPQLEEKVDDERRRNIRCCEKIGNNLDFAEDFLWHAPDVVDRDHKGVEEEAIIVLCELVHVNFSQCLEKFDKGKGAIEHVTNVLNVR